MGEALASVKLNKHLVYGWLGYDKTSRSSSSSSTSSSSSSVSHDDDYDDYDDYDDDDDDDDDDDEDEVKWGCFEHLVEGKRRVLQPSFFYTDIAHLLFRNEGCGMDQPYHSIKCKESSTTLE
ncbi:hypothetical protein M0802_000059 [Mischocyttarus mexicanus]|nr:hypothetical protein M0802_000059 [Mischocyttarus mexicanus]